MKPNYRIYGFRVLRRAKPLREIHEAPAFFNAFPACLLYTMGTFSFLVRYSYNLPEFTRYSARGVNFAPILVGIALYILSRIGAFPLFASEHASKIAGRIARWGVAAAVVAGLGLVLFFAWLFSAPRVIVPSEPGIQYYYKDQKLSEGFLRITPELIEKLGLDSSIPPDSWEISPSFWARGGQPRLFGVYSASR